jgi:hypothetical protein
MLITTIILLLICGLRAPLVLGKISHINVPKDLQCSTNEYFDHSGLVCTQCNTLSNLISKSKGNNKNSNIGCECNSASLLENDICTIEEMQSASCMDITCTSTCSELSLPTSIDHSVCIICASTSETVFVGEGNGEQQGQGQAVYDESDGDCTCSNPPPTSQPTLKPVLNSKLVEIYHSETAEPIQKECVQCPKNTAVITKSLLVIADDNNNGGEENEYYITAGATFHPNPYECVYCPDPNMYFDTDYQCKCMIGYTVVGEASFGTQKCIKYEYEPTLSSSSDYDRVQFPFIREGTNTHTSTSTTTKEGGNRLIVVNSITFSHYYIEAASQCEFSTGYTLERSLNACQTLANLCVMSYYDDSSIPCRQFQSIIGGKRITYYHGQDNWKMVMPWLYYGENEVDDIIEDRSIQMTMSLKGREGSEHHMVYKLAKYTIDGEFLGIEELSNQFMYCVTSRQSDMIGDRYGTKNRKRAGIGFQFGNGFTDEFECNLKSLLSSEMYFYDMYLLDKKCDEKDENNDCLYPVPVLNKNFLQDGDSLPNRNQFFGDELDDKYSRRFFLFDNMVSTRN